MTWTARVRNPDLSLGDPVKYTTLNVAINYLAPATLILTGRLDNIRAAANPGFGLYVTDELGVRKFNGQLTQAKRNGDGTGELTFTSDMACLWSRICWPTPTAAWSAQTAAYDDQTAMAEARIIGFINRNAGPSAYHEAATGTDPGGSTTFSTYATLTPNSLTTRAQCVAVDQPSGDLYMTQASGAGEDDSTPDNLTISRFVAGDYVSSMSLPKGGHGDVLLVSRTGTQVFLTFRYRGLSGSHPDTSKTTWVRIPYTAGKTWTATKALVYKVAAPPSTGPARRGWFQGEAIYDGVTYRLYGTPYNNAGSTQTPAVSPIVERIIGGVIQTPTISVSGLGRSGGNPINGHLEPEGLGIVEVAGQPCLMVGIDTGTSSNRQHYLYTMPIKPTTTAILDRRVPKLRMPTSLGRGVSEKTSARFDILGQLVGTIAEAANLAVDVVQTYDPDGSGWLDVAITDAPDMTDEISVGTPSQGGPIMLGSDWSYTAGIPPLTVALSAAGGEGTARILNSQTADDREEVWGQRIEQFVDQRDSSDTADILAGMQSALDDNPGLSEIQVPLGQSAARFGADIPLGAKISAVLDGQLVAERIRQINVTIAKNDTDPTITTTAVLGSPDAGIQSPAQKQLAAMLRRLQPLERI